MRVSVARARKTGGGLVDVCGPGAAVQHSAPSFAHVAQAVSPALGESAVRQVTAVLAPSLFAHVFSAQHSGPSLAQSVQGVLPVLATLNAPQVTAVCAPSLFAHDHIFEYSSGVER